MNKDDLYPQELELIRYIREQMPFGSFAIIKTRDGLPMIIQTYEPVKITKKVVYKPY